MYRQGLGLARLPARQCGRPILMSGFHSSARAGAIKRKPPAKQLSDEEQAALRKEDLDKQLGTLEEHRRRAAMVPLLDPWNFEVDALDYMLPYKIGFSTQVLGDRIENRIKNALALYNMAANNAFAGTKVPMDTFIDRYMSVPSKALGGGKAWLDGTKAEILSSYKTLMEAIASRKNRDIKLLTTAGFRDAAIERSRANAKNTCIWTMHSAAPLRILSIRVMEGNLDEREPAFGNRLIAHVLARVETEQSLEIYSPRGKTLHEPLDPEAPVKMGERVPAKRRNVVEYLAFEKRMWIDKPWTVREQMWPEVGKEIAKFAK
ncbi:hypothetical protein CYLTODRAFT_419534 [Cylindrobasidium torrendii FP15055 ss-10]|uniref:Tim44-like domain-containing protein n=1 Tax=Cylindrobasidium torrendii FP15055 ss-10 TaxID=1314674 RepID=A0A0D7BJS4_9AGAR|nr:hypothetical protein CYLTODRAFT_419534 [Cylindrobasidium torrendii FP15055 ss-10]